MYLEPDYKSLSNELTKKGVTKKILWEEYIRNCDAINKIPYKYTQFCVKFNKYLEVNKATMHFDTYPR